MQTEVNNEQVTSRSSFVATNSSNGDSVANEEKEMTKNLKESNPQEELNTDKSNFHTENSDSSTPKNQISVDIGMLIDTQMATNSLIKVTNETTIKLLEVNNKLLEVYSDRFEEFKKTQTIINEELKESIRENTKELKELSFDLRDSEGFLVRMLNDLEIRLNKRQDEAEARSEKRYEEAEVRSEKRYEEAKARSVKRFEEAEARSEKRFERAEARSEKRFEEAKIEMYKLHEEAKEEMRKTVQDSERVIRSELKEAISSTKVWLMVTVITIVGVSTALIIAFG